MPTWPTMLPQFALDNGLSETAPAVTIRTETDAGPAKVRRRYTAGPRPVTVRFILSDAEVSILDDFIRLDLKGGALQFTWITQRQIRDTDAATDTDVSTDVDLATLSYPSATYRFVKPPTYNALGATHWEVRLEMEVMP